jgi:hypothetical protein
VDESVSVDGATGPAIMLVTLFFVSSIALYLLPGIIASIRGHRQQLAIWIIDILLGWTFIGWVVALVWACTTPEVLTRFVPVPPRPGLDAAGEIERYAKLHASGALTDAEFATKKAQLLGFKAEDPPVGG